MYVLPMFTVHPFIDVMRRTITLIKSNNRKAQGGEEYITTSDSKEATTSTRRITRARRLPAWYKDYDTDFVLHDESTIEKEEVQAQLPPGIELEDPSTMDKADIPTEEWNIVVYDDDDDEEEEEEEEEEQEDEDEDSPLDYEDEDVNVLNESTADVMLDEDTFS
ncbi:unnamed protein product [Trichobilharzia regenti]|nr:unnamed protein product [Trichobilharzia regenti]